MKLHRSFFAAMAALTSVLAIAAAQNRTLRTRSKAAPISAKDLAVQVLLDRAHFSPGQIERRTGNVTAGILRVFQTEHGLPATGEADDPTMKALQSAPQNAPTLVPYTITYDDVRGPFARVPANMMLKAKLKTLGYQSEFDELGEKFHCTPALLRELNLQTRLPKPTDVIAVPNVHRDLPGKAASVVVSKSEKTVRALDGNGKLLAVYPATIGSEHDPLPIGDWKVTKVFWNPIFYYNPNLFWDARRSDAKAVIQPGPRNPVGAVWIGLNKEHYGIHGTPSPGTIGHVESHGCVRLTNWDAIELGQMVDSGTPVSFRE